MRLYVNGQLSADSATAGGYRRIVGGRSPVEQPLSSHSVRVGMHQDGLHGLVGQLDEVAVWPVALSAADVEHVMCGRLAALADASALAPSFRFSFEDGGSSGGGSGGCCALAPPVGGEAPPRAVVVMPPREKEFATPRTLSLAQTADAAAAAAARASGRAQSLANLERISGIGANEGMAGDDPQQARRAAPTASARPTRRPTIPASPPTTLSPRLPSPRTQDWPLPTASVSGRPPARHRHHQRVERSGVRAARARAQRDETGVVSSTGGDGTRLVVAPHTHTPCSRAHLPLLRLQVRVGHGRAQARVEQVAQLARAGRHLVDCLDNLWIMGMKDEFYEARDWVQHLDFDSRVGT